MRQVAFLALLLPFSLAAQVKPAPTPPAQLPQPTQALQKELADLRKQVEQLRQRTQEQEKRLSDLDAEFYSHTVDAFAEQTAVLDPSRKGYGTIVTRIGTFYVAVDNVEPYLDGQRLTLMVGNPYAASFGGLKLNVEWAKRRSSTDLSGWRKSIRRQEFTDPNDIRSGSWTSVPVVLPNTKAEELGYLSVTLSLERIQMGR